jgi:ArsR family transcriptional regulator
MAGAFKVLADPVRLRLLSLIASVPEGEMCACDLTEPLGRSQATISHHLSVLVNAGLITREQRGKWAWFEVAPNRAEFVRSVLVGQPVMSLG